MKRALARLVLAALAASVSWCAPGTPAPVEVVEFPYAQFPRQLWERELAWLKNIGIRNISLPAGSDPALRGEALALLGRLGLNATAADGLPRVSATAANSLVLSREEILKGRPAILWTDVETTLTPALHAGAVALAGDDLGAVNALRRDARLAQYWGPLFESGTSVAMRGVGGRLPPAITARQITGHGASAAIITNRGAKAWTGVLRAAFPNRQTLALPALTVPAADSLWIPVNVPLAAPQFCTQCTLFGNADRLIYATSELQAMEFENGTLALEFYAPVEGSAVLQTTRQPSGPYLAGGRLKSFDWDNATHRVKITIPAGKAPLFRTRVALAMEAPEQSAFFVDAKRLLIGERNRVLTSYSSPELARRSRLKLPAGWTATAATKSPLEIEYTLDVPAGLVHGDHVEFALEADGVEMSRARPTLVRPVALRVAEGVSVHLGHGQELPVWPPLVPVEQPAGRSITVALRNAAPEIRVFHVAMEATPLEFSPATQEVVVGALAEREITFRVFAGAAATNPVGGWLRVSGAANLTQPVQFVVIPRGQTVVYQAQMDGVGEPEYVLESSRVRAVFANAQGGRWLELVWKESNRSLLADSTALPGPTRLNLSDAVLTLDPAPTGVKLEPAGDVHVESSGGVYRLQRPIQAN